LDIGYVKIDLLLLIGIFYAHLVGPGGRSLHPLSETRIFLRYLPHILIIYLEQMTNAISLWLFTAVFIDCYGGGHVRLTRWCLMGSPPMMESQRLYINWIVFIRIIYQVFIESIKKIINNIDYFDLVGKRVTIIQKRNPKYCKIFLMFLLNSVGRFIFKT